MADVLGILKGTLTGGKVKTNDFKTKVETEVTNLEGTGDPGDAKKAILLKELLKGDTFTKIDLNGDGEITGAELDRVAKIDGKPEFTIEDVRALRRRPPAKAGGDDENSIDNIPQPLRLSMREIPTSEGGYLQPSFRRVPGDFPEGTIIIGNTKINEDNPLDPTNPIVNNFTMFIGRDNYLYISGFEGDYKSDPVSGKDTTDLFEYAISIDKLVEEFAAFNPKERVWIRVPGKNTALGPYAQDKNIDLNLPQIDLKTNEGKKRLLEYIKKHLLVDSSGNLDYSRRISSISETLYHEGIGAKGLRETPLQAATP